MFFPTVIRSNSITYSIVDNVCEINFSYRPIEFPISHNAIYIVLFSDSRRILEQNHVDYTLQKRVSE